MKHLYEFNYYSNSSSNDIDFKYNNNDKFEPGINENPSIEFLNKNIEIIQINLISYHPIYKISFKPTKNEYQQYIITKKEFKYLKNYFINLKKRILKDKEKVNNAHNLINPIIRTTNKYNL